MNLFDCIIINIVLLTSPIIFWMFYVMYNKNIGKPGKDLMFDFSLVTSLYLVIRFGMPLIDNKLFLIINIPLFIAYLRERDYSIAVLSLMIVVYYYYNFDISMFMLFFEYTLYFIIYILLSPKKKNSILVISFLKVIIFIILILLYNKSTSFDLHLILKLLIIILVNIFIVLITFGVCKKSDDIIKYHMTLKELEQEKQFRSTLFRITHEIKNPIAVCKGYLDMFDINNIKHSQKYVPILKEEIERTLILLQDFLSMTQIQIEYEFIDINAVLEDVVDNFIHIFKDKNIKYEIDISNDSYYIYGDYNRMIQVFINIIKNSIEAIDSKTLGEIVIKTEIENNFAKISIKDNGVGFTKEHLERLGEPFLTTKSHGTGLGISLSKEIIKAHNGTINYFSEFNKGTTVVIKIPLINE